MRSLLFKVMVLLVVFGGILSAKGWFSSNEAQYSITVSNNGYGMKGDTSLLKDEYVVSKVRNQRYPIATKKSKFDCYRPKKKYKSTSSIFKKYNYRYKIVAIDTRLWTKNKKDILAKRSIITKFGKDLGKKAIVQNFIMKTSKKRAYLKRVQRELGTHYSYNNAPFLIFFKKAKRGGYKPYKIISLSSMSTPYLKQKLSMLGRAISSGASKRKVYASLEKVRKKVYARNQKKVSWKAKSAMDKIISTLKSWFI